LPPDGRRLNALTLTGLPISYLKTQALFAYSAHFDSAPTGLEWINDRTVALVYPSVKSAKVALRNLRKFLAEDPDEDDFFTAKPIPVNLWPPRSRVQVSLDREPDGPAYDMKQRICIRVARCTDIKEKGARSVSEFYKKYGRNAGKEMYDCGEERVRAGGKRLGHDLDESDRMKRARLDAELDTMHLPNNDGKKGGETVSFVQPLQSRISRAVVERHPSSSTRGAKLTKQSLDDELDAFLKERD
jgi:Nuclear cap-binding protein subunit 3